MNVARLTHKNILCKSHHVRKHLYLMNTYKIIINNPIISRVLRTPIIFQPLPSKNDNGWHQFSPNIYYTILRLLCSIIKSNQTRLRNVKSPLTAHDSMNRRLNDPRVAGWKALSRAITSPRRPGLNRWYIRQPRRFTSHYTVALLPNRGDTLFPLSGHTWKGRKVGHIRKHGN